MNVAILVVCSLNLVVTSTVALVAMKAKLEMQEELKAVKTRSNESIAHAQQVLDHWKF